MNNKIMLSIILLFFSSLSFSNDAILNIEGQIQVNGKTVIDSKGMYVGNIPAIITPPYNQNKSIIFADYFNKLGTYKYKLATYENTGDRRFFSDCDLTIEINEFSFKSTTICGDQPYPNSRTWIDNRDGTETIIKEALYKKTDSKDWSLSKVSSTYKVKLISDSIESTMVGSTVSNVIEKTLINSSGTDYIEDYFNNPQIHVSVIHYSAFIENITVNGNHYKDCHLLLVKSGDNQIRCKNIGLVKSFGANLSSTELISFEPIETSTNISPQIINVNRELTTISNFLI